MVGIAQEKKTVWIVYDCFPLDPETGVWRTNEPDVPVALRNNTLQDALGLTTAASATRHCPPLFDVAMLMVSIDQWGTVSAEEMGHNVLSTAKLSRQGIAAVPRDNVDLFLASRLSLDANQL